MVFMLLGIGCGLAILVLTKTISVGLAKRRCLAEAARLGCEPAPAMPNGGFLGLARILDYLKAMRDQRGPQKFVDSMNEMGICGKVHTARVEGGYHSAGMKRVFSIDRDSVGLGNTGDSGPRECEGSIRDPCIEI